jgi:multidrug efflux pump subunit AcrA (membrane-fusion protein)
MHIILAFLLLFPLSAFAHEGHNHAALPGVEAATPAVVISLARERAETLDIKTVPARLAEVAPMLRVYGRVAALPERQALVSTRFAARAVEVLAQAGQSIKKDDIIARIEPLVFGSDIVALKAPMDGVVTGAVPVEGQVFAPADRLFEVIDLSEVLIIGQVYEDDHFARLKVGQTVQVNELSTDLASVAGRIERLDPSLDENSRALNIYIRAENPEGRLLRNMLVTVSIASGDALPAILVPNTSVLGRDGEPFVFVKVGDMAERRTVKLGARLGDELEIISGVLPDEEVIIQGHYQLQFAPAAEK